MTAYNQGKKAAIKELIEQIELPEELKDDKSYSCYYIDGKYYSTTRTIQLMEEEGDDS